MAKKKKKTKKEGFLQKVSNFFVVAWGYIAYKQRLFLESDQIYFSYWYIFIYSNKSSYKLDKSFMARIK